MANVFTATCFTVIVLLNLIEIRMTTGYPLSFYDVVTSDARLISKMLNQYINGNLDPDDVPGERAPQRIESLSKEERCAQPMRRGFCRALIPRYRYNPTTKQCIEFKFGGCDGNANNFESYKQCMEVCRGV